MAALRTARTPPPPMTHAPSSDRTIHLRPRHSKTAAALRSTQSRAYGVRGPGARPRRGQAAAGWRRRFRQGLSESGECKAVSENAARESEKTGDHAPKDGKFAPFPFSAFCHVPALSRAFPSVNRPRPLCEAQAYPPCSAGGIPYPPAPLPRAPESLTWNEGRDRKKAPA